MANNGTKKTWGFFWFFGSSTFVSQHTWKLLTVHGSMDPGQQLSCKTVVGFNSLYRSNFISIFLWKITSQTSGAISCYLEAKYEYGYYILFGANWSYDSTQKNWAQFDQNWRRDGDFHECTFFLNGCFYFVIYWGQRPPEGPKGPPRPSGAPTALCRREKEGGRRPPKCSCNKKSI